VLWSPKCSWFIAYGCSRRTGVFCGHLSALGSLLMDVHVGLECSVVTLVLFVR
jgi:REP element-mobilizing transposase RayT